VLVIEKMRVPGGNSAICGGLIAVVDSPLQAVEKKSDSPQILVNDMLNAGKGLNHLALTQTVADQSLDAFLWLRDYLGVSFKDDLIHGGGHSVPRLYITENYSGVSVVQALLVKCRELGIPVQLKCAMKNLITDDSGRVIGLNSISGFVFPQQNSGKEKKIMAKKAVILATGGFCQDIKFRMIQNPKLNDSFKTTNHSGATAESLVSALKVGATPVQLSWFQFGPWTSRDENGWGTSSMFTLLIGFPHGIMIDANTGKRFVNELTDRLSRSNEMTISGRDPMIIVGEEAALNYPKLQLCIKRNAVKRYESLEALVLDQSINIATLTTTINEYNKYADTGIDLEFNKPFNQNKRYQIKAPYYLVRLAPKLHYCNGGIQINSQAQVLDISTHKPIPGFYAAGEMTGGVHGASRLGGMSFCECIVFGRIAGINASNESDC